jgi:hypothetical protein
MAGVHIQTCATAAESGPIAAHRKHRKLGKLYGVALLALLKGKALL